MEPSTTRWSTAPCLDATTGEKECMAQSLLELALARIALGQQQKCLAIARGSALEPERSLGM
jgi:hypothetical protein